MTNHLYDQMDLAYARECLKEKDEKIAQLEARVEKLESTLENVYGALGCTDGEDIRSNCLDEVIAVLGKEE